MSDTNPVFISSTRLNTLKGWID